METYNEFAKVYDELMDETPYDKWFEFLRKKLNEYGVDKGLILDLGCGTGIMTEKFAQATYDMIGIDSSMGMLNQAFEKKTKSGLDILYLCQDMRAFELYGTVKGVYSICDSVNYLLEDKDLDKMFRLVNNYLDPDGIFIFDFNTVYKYQIVIGNTVIAENRDDCSFIWENTYDMKSEINEYVLSLFVKEGELYHKYIEEHQQKGYTLEKMKDRLEKSGMKFLEAIDADTLDVPTEKSERIYCIAKEKAVKGKLRKLIGKG
jgi:ubiquinone/menaquinone biosynthesis C-methylase UbiE